MLRSKQLSLLLLTADFRQDFVQSLRLFDLSFGDIDVSGRCLEALDQRVYVFNIILSSSSFFLLSVIFKSSSAIGHHVLFVSIVRLLVAGVALVFFIFAATGASLHSGVVFVVSLNQFSPVASLGLTALVDSLVQTMTIGVNGEALVVRKEHFGQVGLQIVITVHALRN